MHDAFAGLPVPTHRPMFPCFPLSLFYTPRPNSSGSGVLSLSRQTFRDVSSKISAKVVRDRAGMTVTDMPARKISVSGVYFMWWYDTHTAINNDKTVNKCVHQVTCNLQSHLRTCRFASHNFTDLFTRQCKFKSPMFGALSNPASGSRVY